MVHIISAPIDRTLHIGCAATGLIAAMLLALAGCASVPPPDSAMNAAQSQLQAARDAQAADYAPVDLGFAQDKFQQAQGAMAQREYADAAALAEESRADAELARAKARLGAARAQMQAKLEENNRLRARAHQASGANAPAAADQGVPQDMPAPASSMLSAPPVDGGFQSVPEPAQSTDGGFQSVPAPPRSSDNAYQAAPAPIDERHAGVAYAHGEQP